LSVLSAKKVERATEKGRYGDGEVRGLYLQVSANGAKSWLLRYQLDHVTRWMGLGGMEFSLKEARERAKEARQKLADGIDPIDARRDERAKAKAAKAKALTFAQAAQQYHEQHESEWTSRKHAAQFLSSLTTYAFPIIGSLDVAIVGTPEVLKVLEQKVPDGVFWQVRTTTANRVRNRIELVLDWAAVREHRPQGVPNPARWKGHLSEVLAEPSKVARVNHHRAVPYREMPTLMADLSTREGVGVKALRFAILTGARTGEVLGATWKEIDLENAMWTVPAERMKGRREHRVPLAQHVVELLKGLFTGDGTPYVFIGPRTGAQLSETALAEALRRAGRSETVHGLRSSFSDWAHESTSFSNHEIELSLAHTVGNAVEKAYRRGDMLDRRRKLMDAWAKFCTMTEQRKGGDVVPMRGRHA
jgi:integrase